MGALPRPALPDGPVRELFDRLHELHHVAGWPSLREMAKEIGCSHTTVSATFSEPRMPRWGMLELVVETLGGDTEEFHRLWLAATRPADRAVPEPGAVETPTAAAPPRPRQLLADVAAFTGRAPELAELDSLLTSDGTTLPLVVIAGTAGVGKTGLAIHAAHRAAERFPDGQLYLDLRGYSQERPVPVGVALEVLLRALGLEGPAVPHTVPERAARFRTILADRRVLLVLDNAHTVDQVRDLLPGSPGCGVLVTSRGSLPGLVARDGARRIDLDLLPEPDALALLRTLIGSRVDDEPEAAARLVERCARLPLALRLAVELAIARPRASLERLLAELTDESGPLDALTADGDDRTSLRAVFSWSVSNLSPAAADLFALLGLHAGGDIEVAAAAALADQEPGTARASLAELDRAHLVGETVAGRHAMHDLLRQHAAELAAARPAPDTDAAVERIGTHYLCLAARAMDAAFAHSRHHRPAPPDQAAGGPGFGSAAAARAWLRDEWRNVVATALAQAEERPAYLGDVAAVLAPYLEEQAQYDVAESLHERARAAAAARGERRAEAVAVHDLATVSRRQGRYDQALALHREAHAAFGEVDDIGGQARALHGMGVLLWRRGHYLEATERLEQAVALYGQADDSVGQGTALYALGVATRRLGRYAEAEGHHRRAIALLHDAGDAGGEAKARNNLGVVCLFLGRYPEALEHFEVSRASAEENADRLGVAIATDNIATVLGRSGRWEEALAGHHDALALCLEIGTRVGEGDARRGIGVALGGLGRHDEAVVELERAVALGREIGEADIETAAQVELGDQLVALGRWREAEAAYLAAAALAEISGDGYEWARADRGLAAVRAATGRSDEARELWAAALATFAELGVPEAAEVDGLLAGSVRKRQPAPR